MRRLGGEIKDARPSTIVLATPHNLRLFGKIAVVIAENSEGKLPASPHAQRGVRLRVKCDEEFATALLQRPTARSLPVVGATYGTAAGPQSTMPMDWGTLVPLWFFLKENRLQARLVLVAPSREIPLRLNVEFGRAIAELAEREPKRVVFVASADHAHAHRRAGPYGFHTAAANYDQFVMNALRVNRLRSVLRLDTRLVREAKPDSPWQMAMLVGIVDRLKMRAQVYSYHVPTYYGMICASFVR